MCFICKAHFNDISCRLNMLFLMFYAYCHLSSRNLYGVFRHFEKKRLKFYPPVFLKLYTGLWHCFLCKLYTFYNHVCCINGKNFNRQLQPYQIPNIAQKLTYRVLELRLRYVNYFDQANWNSHVIRVSCFYIYKMVVGVNCINCLSIKNMAFAVTFSSI